jgi:hypothetical protein
MLELNFTYNALLIYYVSYFVHQGKVEIHINLL